MSLNRPSYFFIIVFLVDKNSGIFLASAILKEEWANPVMDCGLEGVSRDDKRSEERVSYLVRVVHAHRHALAFEVKHLHLSRWRPISRLIHQLQFPWSRNNEICRSILEPRCSAFSQPSASIIITYLVAKRMPSDDDGVHPPGNRLRYSLQHNRLTEDGSAKDVPDLYT